MDHITERASRTKRATILPDPLTDASDRYDAWSYLLPPTQEQRRLDAQMEFFEPLWEGVDSFAEAVHGVLSGSRLAWREVRSVLFVVALIMSAGYFLCQMQMSVWDWQTLTDYLKGLSQ